MLIRSCVAALDFNFNVNRGTKVSADGNRMYKMKVFYFFRIHYQYHLIFFGGEYNFISHIFSLQIDRTGSRMSIVYQKVKKDYSFQQNILELCVDSLERRRIPNPSVRKYLHYIGGACKLLTFPFSIQLTKI